MSSETVAVPDITPVVAEDIAPAEVAPAEVAPAEPRVRILDIGLRGLVTPEFVEAFRFGVDDEGERKERTDEEQRNAVLSKSIELLNNTPEFQDLGGIDLTNFLAGRFGDSPVFTRLFPNYNEEEFVNSFNEKDIQERRDLLLTRLTGLDEATLEDYAKAAGRGTIISAPAALAARRAGRIAFTVAPPVAPLVGPFSKPAAGVAAGLSAALATSLGTVPLAETLLPKPDRATLFPGEEDYLAGTETAAMLLAGSPQSFFYKRAANSPAVILDRLRQGQANSQAQLTTPMSLRTSAYISDMLPNLTKLARQNPKKFIASEAMLAGLSGAVVAEAELEKDPVLRAFVELGLGLTPTYSIVNVSAKSGVAANKLRKFVGDYNPISPMMLGRERRARTMGNLARVAGKVRTFGKEEPKRPGVELLDTVGGRRAVQQLLEIVIDMGEDPKAIARRFAEGEDPFADLPQEVLDTINRGGTGVSDFDAESIIGSLSYGMQTRSPAILALESYFANQAKKENTDAASKKAADFNRALIKVFSLAGDKGGLARAQEAQQARFANLFADKLNAAVNKAVAAAKRVPSSYTRTLPEGEREAEDTRIALVRALETQFDYAGAISSRLYRDAEVEVPNITAFKNADGEEIDLPEFIRFFDDEKAKMNPETLERVSSDSYFKEIEKTIERIKVELGGTPARPELASEKKLKTLLDSTAGSASQKTFNDIITGQSLTGRSATGNREPLLSMGDDGRLLATDENISILGKIISDRARAPGKGDNFKQSQRLLQAQKDVLVERLQQPDPVPVDGVEFRTLNNLRKSITDATKDRREKADNLYGIYAQMKGLIHADIDHTIDPGVSKKLDVARNFYRGFGDAILRSVAGKATKEKGYDERVLDPEEFARGLLRGNMDQKLSKFKELFNASRFLTERSRALFDEDEIITGVSEPIRGAVENTANSVKGFASQTLARDIIAPLEKAIIKAEEDAAGLADPLQRSRLVSDRANAALNRIQTELKGESGVAFREILQDDVVDSIIQSTDAVATLNRSKQLLGQLNQQVKQDFALSQAVNSEQPLKTIHVAITSNQPQRALDSLIRTIRRAARDDKNINEEEALAGLKSQLFEYVFQNAGGASRTREFDPNAAYRLLFNKGVSFTKNPDTSLSDYMVRSGLADQKTLEGYKKVLTAMASFDAGARVQGGDVLVDGVNPSIVDDLMLRIGGAKLGAAIGEMTPGARGTGLVEAQAGVRFAQNFFQKIPLLQQFDALRLIVEDPELLSIALKRGLDPSQKAGAVKYFFKKLKGQLGEALIPDARTFSRAPALVPRVVQPSDFEVSPEEEEEGETAPVAPRTAPAPAPARAPGKQSSLDVEQFNLPSRQFMPQLAQAAQPAAPGPRPTGQANPQQRAGLASLFPNDPILGAGRNVG